MRVLGAILAGGAARRFGSDKAVAELDGVSLIARVEVAIRAQVETVVICGRAPGLGDRPAGIGPLGGIAAALHHGAALGFDRVLSVPCDTPLLPRDLVDRLSGDGPAFVAGLPVIGLWPCVLAECLDTHLAAQADRSMRGWTRAICARPVTVMPAIPNVNTPIELDALRG